MYQVIAHESLNGNARFWAVAERDRNIRGGLSIEKLYHVRAPFARTRARLHAGWLNLVRR